MNNYLENYLNIVLDSRAFHSLVVVAGRKLLLENKWMLRLHDQRVGVIMYNMLIQRDV